MDSLFNIYTNLLKFITYPEYRGYTLLKPELDMAKFEAEIYSKTYILSECKSTAGKIDIILFEPTSKYIKTTAPYRSMMGRLNLQRRGVKTVIFITKDPLSVYIRKAILEYSSLYNIFSYRHKFFTIELPRGPHCSQHRILEYKEACELLNQLKCPAMALPTIDINDPQCIWVGAEYGNIIEIRSFSEIAGMAIRYRIVSPVGITIIDNPELDDEEENEEEKKVEGGNKDQKEEEKKEEYYDDSDY